MVLFGVNQVKNHSNNENKAKIIVSNPVEKSNEEFSYEDIISRCQIKIDRLMNENNMQPEDMDMALIQEVMAELTKMEYTSKLSNADVEKISLKVITDLSKVVKTKEAKTALIYYSMKNEKKPIEVDFE
jgi:hypothetical protein